MSVASGLGNLISLKDAFAWNSANLINSNNECCSHLWGMWPVSQKSQVFGITLSFLSSLSLSFCWSWSNVSRIKSLSDCYMVVVLKMVSKLDLRWLCFSIQKECGSFCIVLFKSNLLTTSVGWRYPRLLVSSEVLLHSCMVLEFSKTLDSGALDPGPQTRAQFWGPSTVAWYCMVPEFAAVVRCLPGKYFMPVSTNPRFVVFFNNFHLSPHQSNEELFQQQHLWSTDTSLTDFADMLLLSL